MFPITGATERSETTVFINLTPSIVVIESLMNAIESLSLRPATAAKAGSDIISICVGIEAAN